MIGDSLKEINTFIQQGCNKLIKSDSEDISVSNKCCSFEISIHQRILKKLHVNVSILEWLLKDFWKFSFDITGINQNKILYYIILCVPAGFASLVQTQNIWTTLDDFYFLFFLAKILKLDPFPSNFLFLVLPVIIKVSCWQSIKELSFLGNILMRPFCWSLKTIWIFEYFSVFRGGELIH